MRSRKTLCVVEVWVQSNECKLCGAIATEKHRLYHLQMADEVGGLGKRLPKMTIVAGYGKKEVVSLLGASAIERNVDFEQAHGSQFYRWSKASENWDRKHAVGLGTIGSLRRRVIRYAACGWAVVPIGS